MNMPKRITLKEVAALLVRIEQGLELRESQKVHVSEATEQRIWYAVRELNYTPS
jgi:DNA-binding LacI/PurR family transcriptional regulator